jgi:hypothetical protein
MKVTNTEMTEPVRRQRRRTLTDAMIASLPRRPGQTYYFADVEMPKHDRHRYLDEKSLALRKLAALIERIANPPADNVVPLHEAAAS